MIWDDDRLTALYYDAVLDVDPAGATINLSIGSSTIPMDWDGPATTVTTWDATRRRQVTRWQRTAHTATLIGGVSVTPGAERVILTAGIHTCEMLVSIGSSIIPARPFTLTALPAGVP